MQSIPPMNIIDLDDPVYGTRPRVGGIVPAMEAIAPSSFQPMGMTAAAAGYGRVEAPASEEQAVNNATEWTNTHAPG